MKGKIFDSEGALYTPMCSNKGRKQYRYYVSKNLVQNRHHPKELFARLPAYEIETAILSALTTKMQDIEALSNMLFLDLGSHYRALAHVSKNTEILHDLHKAIERVIIYNDHLAVDIFQKTLTEQVNEAMGLDIQQEDDHGSYRIEFPYHTMCTVLITDDVGNMI